LQGLGIVERDLLVVRRNDVAAVSPHPGVLVDPPGVAGEAPRLVCAIAAGELLGHFQESTWRPGRVAPLGRWKRNTLGLEEGSVVENHRRREVVAEAVLLAVPEELV